MPAPIVFSVPRENRKCAAESRQSSSMKSVPTSSAATTPSSAIGHSGTRLRIPNYSTMFVNSVSVEVVGGAYQIAANYLMQTGQIPIGLDIYQPLLDSIVEDY